MICRFIARISFTFSDISSSLIRGKEMYEDEKICVYFSIDYWTNIDLFLSRIRTILHLCSNIFFHTEFLPTQTTKSHPSLNLLLQWITSSKFDQSLAIVVHNHQQYPSVIYHNTKTKRMWIFWTFLNEKTNVFEMIVFQGFLLMKFSWMKFE